jgi:hypothetical protein
MEWLVYGKGCQGAPIRRRQTIRPGAHPQSLQSQSLNSIADPVIVNDKTLPAFCDGVPGVAHFFLRCRCGNPYIRFNNNVAITGKE